MPVGVESIRVTTEAPTPLKWRDGDLICALGPLDIPLAYGANTD